MRASVAVEKLREILQASDATEWSTRELVSHLNRHAIALSRRMAEVDEGYFNHTLQLASADAVQAKSDVYDYDLPPWIERIVEVRRSSDPTAPAGASRSYVLPYIEKFGLGGWRYSGAQTLQTVGLSDPQDLELIVAKRPANVTKGALPTQANLPTPNTSYVRIDADSSADAADYPHETLADSYINAIVEITGANARSGQIRRVVGSTHFQDEGGVLYTVLQVHKAWAVQPQAADTYELHFEVPEQHMQLVIYLAAHTLWGVRGQFENQKSYAGMISEEMGAFNRHITPRQVQQPARLRHSILPFSAGSVDRNEDTQQPLWT